MDAASDSTLSGGSAQDLAKMIPHDLVGPWGFVRAQT